MGSRAQARGYPERQSPVGLALVELRVFGGTFGEIPRWNSRLRSLALAKKPSSPVETFLSFVSCPWHKILPPGDLVP